MDDFSVDGLVLAFEIELGKQPRPTADEWARLHPESSVLLTELRLTEFRYRRTTDEPALTTEAFLAGRSHHQPEELLLGLIAIELETACPRDNLIARFPQWQSEIAEFADALDSEIRSCVPLGLLSRSASHSHRPDSARSTQSEHPLPAGTQCNLNDTFVIQRMFDQGGLKWVHLAQQAAVGRVVALKTSKSPDATVMIQEGQLLAKLEHPNIPRVLALGSTESEVPPVLVESFIAGENWADRLQKERAAAESHPSERRAAYRLARLRENIEILKTVGLPLQYAHETWSVIHGDVKPKNVMLGRFGEVSLLDWGLAVQVGVKPNPELPIPHASQINQFRGTPSYVSPELAGVRSELISPRTDVFLMGAVLFELLTGRPPYHAESPQARLQQFLAAREASLPELRSTPEHPIPEDLAAIAKKAMALNPGDRYPSVFAFCDALSEHQRRAAAADAVRDAAQEYDTIAKELACATTNEARRTQIGTLIAVADRFHRASVGIDDSPESSPVLKKARFGEQEARNLLVKLSLRLGDFSFAQEQLERLTSIAPDSIEDWALQGELIRKAVRSRSRTIWIARIASAALLIACVALGVAFVEREGLLNNERQARFRAETSERAERTAAQTAKLAEEKAKSQRDESIALLKGVVRDISANPANTMGIQQIRVGTLSVVESGGSKLLTNDPSSDDVRELLVEAHREKGRQYDWLVPVNHDLARDEYAKALTLLDQFGDRQAAYVIGQRIQLALMVSENRFNAADTAGAKNAIDQLDQLLLKISLEESSSARVSEARRTNHFNKARLIVLTHGKLEDAVAHYQVAYEETLQEITKSSDDHGLHWSAASCARNIAEIQVSLGQFDNASATMQIARSRWSEFLERTKLLGNPFNQGQFASLLFMEGEIHLQCGRLREAFISFADALNKNQQATKGDPANPAWRRAIIDCWSRIAFCTWLYGDNETSLEFAEIGEEIYMKTILANPDGQDRIGGYLQLATTIGNASLALGAWDALQGHLASLELVIASDPESLSKASGEWNLKLFQGLASHFQNHSDDARKAFEALQNDLSILQTNGTYPSTPAANGFAAVVLGKVAVLSGDLAGTKQHALSLSQIEGTGWFAPYYAACFYAAAMSEFLDHRMESDLTAEELEEFLSLERLSMEQLHLALKYGLRNHEFLRITPELQLLMQRTSYTRFELELEKERSLFDELQKFMEELNPASKAEKAAEKWQVGDQVEVEWKGSWYPATILRIEERGYMIHYKDHDDSWDEVVGTDRIRSNEN